MVQEIKVHQCHYHRNGISGIGFYAIGFSFVDDKGNKRLAVATVNCFDVDAVRGKKPHDPDTRILMVAKDYGLALEETMRGDYFHEELCNFLITEQDKK